VFQFCSDFCLLQRNIIAPFLCGGVPNETRRFFLLTNLAVMLVLSVVTSLLGVNKFLTANGLNVGMLFVLP
jgi:hypothetical protein